MCGIVGYTGTNDAGSILLDGLKKLEYRGYDSAGIALQKDDKIIITKKAGPVARLEESFADQKDYCTVGIGHTRWATHGRPTDENAHPHSSCSGDLAIVHNGIIENYQPLRQWLIEEKGHHFSSETDTEVIAHLIEEYYESDLLAAVQVAVSRLEGSYALVVMTSKEPGLLVCARKDSPLIIGLGEGENFIASDLPALLSHTRRCCILNDNEYALVSAGEVIVYDRSRRRVEKKVTEISWDLAAAEKGGYDHFMLKEIMEQPAAVRETLRQRVKAGENKVILSELKFTPAELAALDKIHIVACGTAYHAGLLGKAVIERIAGIPVEVDVASEFRYREPIINENNLVLVISQSGETADTLAGLRLARSKGVKVLAVTNVVGSTVSREADEVFYTWAGPEIAVASTKAYLTQLIAMYLLALYLGEKRGSLDADLAAELIEGLATLPQQIQAILAEENLSRLHLYCEHLAKWDSAFFIGRNLDYAVAMEGALKLKEISYIHAEAYAAGELKHGPLALIVEGIPVIALATQKAVLEKIINNIQVVKARGGYVFAITQDGFDQLAQHADAVFTLPAVHDLLAPVLSVIPTQLIAYYAALARGSAVDKPRNLAKSVTVE